MKYRPLGKSSVLVSEISLGTSAIGGLNWIKGASHGWPTTSDDEVLAAIRLAVDRGVNHFDTADLYGNGTAERRIAAAFHKLGLRSEDFVIASKTGFLTGSAPHPYDPFHIRHQCEQSLRNLGRDYLDLYYLHNANFGPDDCYLQPAAETLDALLAEGKIRLKGQSAYSEQDFQKTIPIVRPSVIQSRANALADYFVRPGSVVSELMARDGITFIAFSPLQQGLLLGLFHPDRPPKFENGDVRSGNRLFRPEFLSELQPRLERFQARFGTDIDRLAAVCIRFVLDHPHVSAVIHGFRGPAEVASNLHAEQCELTDEDRAHIREIFSGLRV